MCISDNVEVSESSQVAIRYALCVYLIMWKFPS